MRCESSAPAQQQRKEASALSPADGGVNRQALHPPAGQAAAAYQQLATVTDAPGWGVEINPAWLERAEYQVSTLD